MKAVFNRQREGQISFVGEKVFIVPLNSDEVSCEDIGDDSENIEDRQKA